MAFAFELFVESRDREEKKKRKDNDILTEARHRCTAFFVPVPGGELNGRHEVFDGG